MPKSSVKFQKINNKLQINSKKQIPNDKKNPKNKFQVIPQSLVYFTIDKHSTAANPNHTMYESIKTKRRDAEVAEERREKQTKTSIKTQKRQYNEKVKTFLCAPLRSLRLCVGKETEIFMFAGYVYLRLRCYIF